MLRKWFYISLVDHKQAFALVVPSLSFMPPSQSRISFLPVSEKNVEVFKVINLHCLPVRYGEKFYTDLIKTPGDFTKFAMVNDVFVGGIGCRLEPREDGRQDLYVMTLSVLTAYRRLGVGRKLLESVLASLSKHTNIARVYLHVQTSNDAALAFYPKFGFVATATIPEYYKRIEPTTAVLLEYFPASSSATLASSPA